MMTGKNKLLGCCLVISSYIMILLTVYGACVLVFLLKQANLGLFIEINVIIAYACGVVSLFVSIIYLIVNQMDY